MMYCFGKGPASGKCQWRDVCSRYVLGRAAANDVTATWIDSCTNGKRFVRCGTLTR